MTEIRINGIDYLLEETIVPEGEVNEKIIGPHMFYSLHRVYDDDDVGYGELEYDGRDWEWLHGTEGLDGRDWLLGVALSDSDSLNWEIEHQECLASEAASAPDETQPHTDGSTREWPGRDCTITKVYESKAEIRINGKDYLMADTMIPEHNTVSGYVDPQWYYCIYQLLRDDDGTHEERDDEIGYKGKLWKRMQVGVGREARNSSMGVILVDADTDR